MPWARSGSSISAPTVMRGFSEENGSWKMNCNSRRRSRSSAGPRSSRCRGRRSAPTRQRAPAAAPAGAPGWTCRSRIRRRWRRSRPSRSPAGYAGHRMHLDRVAEQRLRAPESAFRRRSSSRIDASGAHARTSVFAGSAISSSFSSGARQQAAAWPGAIVGQRRFLGAARDGEGAARGKAAAGGHVSGRRHDAGDRHQPPRRRPTAPASSSSARWCRGAAGRRRSRPTGPVSTTLPAYITATRSAISATTPRSWVIRISAAPVSALQLAHQVQDLRLDGHVQRRRRFVRDQQRRVVGQRHRDHHPLPHAARKLVRVIVQPLLGRRDPHPAQHLQRPRPRPPMADSPWWRRTLSAICSPMRMAGFSAVIGS